MDDVRVVSRIIYVAAMAFSGRTRQRPMAHLRRSAIASSERWQGHAGIERAYDHRRTHLKAHRVAASLLKEGMFLIVSVEREAA